MWLTLLCVGVCAYIVWRYMFGSQADAEIDLIPGSTESPIWSLIRGRAPNPAKFHIFLAEQAKKYGPVMKIPMLNSKPIVFVNGYEAIHQSLVKLGREVGGRPKNQFRWNCLTQQTGILGNPEPDEKWNLLRKITQHHLKQFGDGLSHLEVEMNSVAERMFATFDTKCGVPFDPRNVINDVITESIIFLTTNQNLPSHHPLVQKMKEYNAKYLQYLSHYAPANILMLDFFPWLRHFGWPGHKVLLRHQELESEIWNMLIEMNEGDAESETIIKALKSEVGSGIINDIDARKATFTLLFAGAVTTYASFYHMINILAHHPEVHSRIFSEIQEKVGRQTVTVADRSNMPYTEAVLLEALRFSSIAPVGAPHRTCVDVTIEGYKIPKDTTVMQNLYYLHRNPEFWVDPNTFRPDRFLEKDGSVVSSDHPSRKHLIPFGAGHRVCAGEVLARSRLFLWLSLFVQRFEVEPAPGNTTSNLQSENFFYEATLSAPPYQVVLKKRM